MARNGVSVPEVSSLPLHSWGLLPFVRLTKFDLVVPWVVGGTVSDRRLPRRVQEVRRALHLLVDSVGKDWKVRERPLE